MQTRWTAMLLAVLLLVGRNTSARNEQGHGDRQIKHVLIISVDGMHNIDLADYIKAKPDSAFAHLTGTGVTYSNASASRPSDSFPGVIAMVTGGSPQTTGIWYDNSFDRVLNPNGTPKAHPHQMLYDESIDYDLTKLDAGGGINPAYLPLDPANKPVWPHEYLRVNTVFQVIKSAGLRTAWSEKHPCYDIVNGPSLLGPSPSVDDLYDPEINAMVGLTSAGQITDIAAQSTTGPLQSVNTSVLLTKAYDELKVQAILNEIAGKDHSGASASVPALFGMNFQAVSVGQKLASDSLLHERGGYLSAAGAPTHVLNVALDYVDEALGRMLAALDKAHLRDSTLVIVTAKHGNAPIAPGLLKKVGHETTEALLGARLAQQTSDDVALLWLDPSKQDQARAVAATLMAHAADSGVNADSILWGNSLTKLYDDPRRDSRTPDIILVPNPGVIYTSSKSKIAEHGGFSADDTNVMLIVSNPGLNEHTVRTSVTTRQIAPTILKSLGLDPHALKAVQIEGTHALPGLAISAGSRR